MIRILARLVRLAAWFVVGWAAAELVAAVDRRVDLGHAFNRGRLAEALARIIEIVEAESPGTEVRYFVGPDDPGGPSLGRAMAAAVDLAEHSPGPSPTIRLRIPEPTR